MCVLNFQVKKKMFCKSNNNLPYIALIRKTMTFRRPNHGYQTKLRNQIFNLDMCKFTLPILNINKNCYF